MSEFQSNARRAHTHTHTYTHTQTCMGVYSHCGFFCVRLSHMCALFTQKADIDALWETKSAQAAAGASCAMPVSTHSCM